jgi:hypothetical protein
MQAAIGVVPGRDLALLCAPHEARAAALPSGTWAGRSAGPLSNPGWRGGYDGVARLRRLRPDGGLESSLEATDGRVPPRSIRTTGRMTTIAAPACTGSGFWCGARRGSGNTCPLPDDSESRAHRHVNVRSDPPHDLRPSWLMARYQTRTVAICSRAPGRNDNGIARILERGCAGEGWKRRSDVRHGGFSVRVRARRSGAFTDV